MAGEEPPGERPRWSVTWLFRVQRVGRNRPPPGDADGPRLTGFWRAIPWIVIFAIGLEIAIGVWLDYLPR